jgi:vitamin B12 transporter
MSKLFWVAGLLPVAAIAAPQTDTSTTAETMVVTASRFAEPEASILAPVNIVTREEISRLQAKTVTEVMRTLPGVETISYGGHGQSASTAVRGGTSAQTLVLLDGVRVNAITSGGANLNDLPLNQVERIEYVRGARASIYGADAIGGVINIITRPDVGTQRHQFSGGAGSRGERQLGWSSTSTVGTAGQLKGAAGFEQEDGYNVHPVAGVNDGDEHGYEGYNAMLDYQQAFNNQFDLFTTARWFRNQAQYDNSYTGSWGSQHERKETWSEKFERGI